MKFTIATIHHAYGLSYIPDGKLVESELNSLQSPVSLADINWLRPSDDHKYISDMMLEDEIAGLERVELALQSYFKEQFDESDSRLLWLPNFHKMHLFCEHYLENKSVFGVENTILSKVLNEIATEVEVLVFYIGEKSLTKLENAKLQNEEFFVNSMNIKVLPHEITKTSKFFEALLKNYSLTMISRQKATTLDSLYLNNPVLLEQFSNYGKLERL